jgi:hypothetical protein
MKFNIRRVHNYFDVSVEADNTKIDLGMMDEQECANFAEQLRQTADDICPDDVPYDELVAAYLREKEAAQ